MIDDEKQIRELLNTLSKLIYANPPYDKEAIEKACDATYDIDFTFVDDKLCDSHAKLTDRAIDILNDKPVSNWQIT